MNNFPPEVMKRFRDEYISTVPEKLKTMERLLDEMHDSVREKTLQDLRLLVNKIAGSAGTYGFAAVSDVCKEFETEILSKIALHRGAVGDPRWAVGFREYLVRIKKGFLDVKS